MEFKHPLNIIFIIIPILCCVFLILGYRKKERILNLLKIRAKIKYKILRIILTALGLGLILFSLLGPQLFIGISKVKKEGLDIYVLFDTSKSMLVEDIKPDRISRAKNIVASIIDNLEGDRIGFIPFSSSAYVQMPLTDDYQLAHMFLDVIDTDMIGGGGTDIGNAVKLAYSSFERTSSADRVIIIISDGEEHNNNSVKVLEQIKDERLKVYTIGVGTENGGLVPEYDSLTGAWKKGYKKDSSGEFVVSKLQSKTLRELASAGNGAYYQSSLSGDEIASLIKDISFLKRGTVKTEEVRRYKQMYQFFLAPGILLFLVAYFLPERRYAS
ncbi:MAG TPA: VWA domain-containing protein [Acetivibrio sp.]|nr:VWA domain-containing protein [Clostridium sp.]HOQ37279.1 VWA domain-containing protein [Acetivibrio sp.]HPT90470.1 VWA domain-containing protein [Acetivibrio sp.]HQA56569.1 VWA domain-containing protein [Acetivibrio sp.]